jgi:DNA-binding MarR family transcriptional regulator
VVELAGRDGRPPHRKVTEHGRATLRRLADARRAHLTELLAEWTPENREALATRLGWVAREPAPDARPPAL